MTTQKVVSNPATEPRNRIELSPEAEQRCWQAAEKLAAKLEEPKVDLLYRILAAIGPTLAKELAEEALKRQVSENPLLKVGRKKRPRSKGGAFIYLTKPHWPQGHRRWIRIGDREKLPVRRDKVVSE